MDNKKKQQPTPPHTKEKNSSQEKPTSAENNKEKLPGDIYEDDGNTHGVYESEKDYW